VGANPIAAAAIAESQPGEPRQSGSYERRRAAGHASQRRAFHAAQQSDRSRDGAASPPASGLAMRRRSMTGGVFRPWRAALTSRCIDTRGVYTNRPA